jgi:hypothetical protein
MGGGNSELPVGECNSVWDSFSFRPENWDVPSRSSTTSEFNTISNNHLQAGWLNNTCLREIPELLVRKCNSSWEGFNFRPENWDLSCRRSGLSSWTTELNTDRNHHPPAGRFNATSLGEIINFRSENAIPLGTDSTIWPENWDLPAEAGSFLLEQHSSILVETIISGLED